VQGAAENMMTRPFGLYGLTKKTGEQICASIGHGTVLRFANVYGPRQDASAESGAIARWTHAALTGQICHVFGDGRAVRDFVYVEDVAKVLEWAAVGGPLAAPPMSPCLFHVGTGTGYRMEQVLQEIQRQTDQAVKVRWERPRVEIRQSILWPGNLKQALPWDWAPLSLNAGLARTLAWAQNEYGVLTDDGPVMAAPPTLD
jgi:UDP-glucose 4-epimerase